MTDVIANAGDDPVEAAIAAGKILPSRRAHYRDLMAKRPKATRKLLAELEPVFVDGYELPEKEIQREVQRIAPSLPPGRAAAATHRTSAPGAGGPDDYPRAWLNHQERNGPAPVIAFEDPSLAAAGMVPRL
jgi:hypothetical protein